MPAPVFTHDRVKIDSGVLAPSKGALFGDNALQSVQIGRHTPREAQQAVGFLGIVDYVSGIVTSDVQLDVILTEGSSKANTSTKTSSIYRYANKAVSLTQEDYVLMSAALAFAAGAPATMNLGYMTASLASYIDVLADSADLLEPGLGEESDFAVVMGDDGSGIELVPAWWTSNSMATSTIPILTASGTRGSTSDNSIPAGVQSLNMSGTINRDNVLDVRTAQPIQFITTYPINISADMNVLKLPTTTSMPQPGSDTYNASTFVHQLRNLRDLTVQAIALGKHVDSSLNRVDYNGNASAGEVYAKVIGLRQVDESEAVSVGRYLSHTVNFVAADLLLPLAPLP